MGNSLSLCPESWRLGEIKRQGEMGRECEHHPCILIYDLHIECGNSCRSAVIWKYVQKHPEALAQADFGYLPLHKLLANRISSTEDALLMMEKYPAALQHQNSHGVPLHLECKNQCRSAIIRKCIELYPEALAEADKDGYLPLHRLLENEFSSVEDALLMMEKYPAAL